MDFDEFEDFEIGLSSCGYFSHEIDLGVAGEITIDIDPDDLVGEFEKDLESVSLSTAAVAAVLLANPAEFVDVLRQMIEDSSEEILLERLASATE